MLVCVCVTEGERPACSSLKPCNGPSICTHTVRKRPLSVGVLRFGKCGSRRGGGARAVWGGVGGGGGGGWGVGGRWGLEWKINPQCARLTPPNPRYPLTPLPPWPIGPSLLIHWLSHVEGAPRPPLLFPLRVPTHRGGLCGAPRRSRSRSRSSWKPRPTTPSRRGWIPQYQDLEI